MGNKPANAYLLLTLASLFWAGNMIVGRMQNGVIPPFTLAFWRWMIALALLLPLSLPYLPSQWPLLKRHWRIITALGILSVGGYNTFVYLALRYTTATNAAMLNSFIPVATIALSFMLFNRRLTRAEAIGVCISLLGVLTIVGQGSLESLLSLRLNSGDLWMLCAVLVWGLYTVGLQWRPQGIHPMLLMSAFTVAGLLAITPLYAWELVHGATLQITPATVTSILFIGIFPGFLGYIFYNAGIAAVGPNRGALFLHLMPVFGTLLAAIFLGELPGWYHFMGISLVFAGIIMTTRSR